MQQASFNPTSSYSKILIIWHLMRISQDQSCAFYQKKLHHWERHISVTCSNLSVKSVCVCVNETTFLVSLTAYLLIQQLLQLGRLQKTQKSTLMTQTSGRRRFTNGILYFFCQSIGAVTKNCQ